jgi:hypothetical protein
LTYFIQTMQYVYFTNNAYEFSKIIFLFIWMLRCLWKYSLQYVTIILITTINPQNNKNNYISKGQYLRNKKKINSVAFIPQANYTDRATAACRWS